ncbi:hypothetical protein CDV31_017001, partial [Fusarium ambrosium]
MLLQRLGSSLTANAIAILAFAGCVVAGHPRSIANITPHEQYSSSIGVLGCKINNNRVAYWPGSVGCDDICIRLYNEGRSVHLLRIDTSGGAYDISYDAWNYLVFGKSAVEEPHMGGGIDMNYDVVHASECQHLLYEGKLPLSAANSMNYVASCLAQPGSWVAQNYLLYNINDQLCKIGSDDECHLDLTTSNQPSCPSPLGIGTPLDYKVENIQYGTVNCASEVFLFSLFFQDDPVADGLLRFSVRSVFINPIKDCQSLSFIGAVLDPVAEEVTRLGEAPNARVVSVLVAALVLALDCISGDEVANFSGDVLVLVVGVFLNNGDVCCVVPDLEEGDFLRVEASVAQGSLLSILKRSIDAAAVPTAAIGLKVLLISSLEGVIETV